ncbi:MFS transporter [Streptomyces sp. WMMC1477]|uniref:MFS transporter n=1 Tax=Streptomyces sp. WMMC1477 TaxID=3015155 RepID=UPI0022B73561|nr:MFS transporter [Streptomyces sp. WMMC1477]MCZ7433747.1 MFS transporter [Streptomyces sp. WMMC1477]
MPRSFWVVFAGQFINRIGSMVVPFLVLYLGDRGLSSGDAGLVLGAVGLGGLFSQPLGGVLADRWGPRFALVTGLATSAVAIALLGMATGLPATLAAGLLVGLVVDIYRPAAAALVAMVVAAGDRTRAYSLVYWAVNLGVALGGLVAGLLARHGYWLLFVVQAVTTAAFAVVAATLLPDDRPAGATVRRRPLGRLFGRRVGPHAPAGGPRDAEGRNPAGEEVGGREGPGGDGSRSGVLRDRLLLALICLNLVNGVVAAQITVGLPLAIKDDGLSSTVYGSVFLASGVIIGVSQPLLSAWLERYDRLTVLSVSWLVFGVGIACTGLADSVPEYLITVVVWTLGEIGAASFVGSLVADLAPDHAQGRYQAAFGWSFAAAQFLGPPLGAQLYVSVGPDALWWTCAALGVAGLAGGLALTRPVRRRLRPDTKPLTLQKAL